MEKVPASTEPAEKTDGVLFMHTEYKDLLLCWPQGEGESGRGGVEIVSFENVNTTYPEHTHIEPCVISGVRFFEIISVKR